MPDRYDLSKFRKEIMFLIVKKINQTALILQRMYEWIQFRSDCDDHKIGDNYLDFIFSFALESSSFLVQSRTLNHWEPNV